MYIFQFLNQRRGIRLIWPCVSAVIGSLFYTEASAQNAISSQANTNGAAAEAISQTPTYLRDIQPIFMGSCSRCHNQQTRFIYDWLDYKTVYADRWEIRRGIWDSWEGRYYKEAMPVANSPESLALTDEERSTIMKWVDQGGLRGEPPPPGAARSKAERIELGRRLFTSVCAAC